MSEKTDHTAAIFDKLGITPETQPWAYLYESTGVKCCCLEFWDTHPPDCPSRHKRTPIPLLSDKLISDGLAVRLIELARGKVGVVGLSDLGWTIHIDRDAKYTFIDKMPLAHAVHDALVEALGITEDGEE
jgi:hypothetical protein